MPGRQRGHQAYAPELAQAASGTSRNVLPIGVAGKRVDAAARGSDLGEVPIDRLNGRRAVGPERDQISHAQGVDPARGDRHVVGVTHRSLDDGVERPSVEFVAQALAEDAPDDSPLLDAAMAIRQSLTRVDHMEARGVAAVQAAVHLLEDVAPLPELAQLALPVFGEHPAIRRHFLGEAKTLSPAARKSAIALLNERVEEGFWRHRGDEPKSRARIYVTSRSHSGSGGDPNGN